MPAAADADADCGAGVGLDVDDTAAASASQQHAPQPSACTLSVWVPDAQTTMPIAIVLCAAFLAQLHRERKLLAAQHCTPSAPPTPSRTLTLAVSGASGDDDDDDDHDAPHTDVAVDQLSSTAHAASARAHVHATPVGVRWSELILKRPHAHRESDDARHRASSAAPAGKRAHSSARAERPACSVPAAFLRWVTRA